MWKPRVICRHLNIEQLTSKYILTFASWDPFQGRHCNRKQRLDSQPVPLIFYLNPTTEDALLAGVASSCYIPNPYWVENKPDMSFKSHEIKVNQLQMRTWQTIPSLRGSKPQSRDFEASILTALTTSCLFLFGFPAIFQNLKVAR